MSSYVVRQTVPMAPFSRLPNTHTYVAITVLTGLYTHVHLARAMLTEGDGCIERVDGKHQSQAAQSSNGSCKGKRDSEQ